MPSREKSCRSLLACPLLAGCLLLLANCPGVDQLVAAQATPESHPAASSATQAGTLPAASQPSDSKITPQQADELFRDVDEILKFASDDTALPIKKEVKRRLTSRDEVVAYLEKSMAEDKNAQRLRRSALVLKKFGLVPAEFDLQRFLVSLLREQVAGYYDPKTQTVNLLDWVDADAQRPVLAHELTHALQDQSFGLEKWLKAGDTDLDEKKNLTYQDFEDDEIAEARQAVVEGEAMAVLVDYILAPAGQSLLASPRVAQALSDGMLLGTADSPQFQNAPVFMKEALTFPYRYGLEFVAALLKQGGKDKAFSGALQDPPRTTRQIMEPRVYLSGDHLEAMALPDFDRDLKNYDRFDVGAMGEFDVAMLVDQYAGVEVSRDLYPHWRGGYYYSAHPKGDPSAPLGLLYASRWSDGEKASQFAAIYARALEKRYQHVREVAMSAPGPAHASRDVESLTGSHRWLTEDGAVVIEVHGETVLITESLDQAATEALERDLFPPEPPSQPKGPSSCPGPAR